MALQMAPQTGSWTVAKAINVRQNPLMSNQSGTMENGQALHIARDLIDKVMGFYLDMQ